MNTCIEWTAVSQSEGGRPELNNDDDDDDDDHNDDDHNDDEDNDDDDENDDDNKAFSFTNAVAPQRCGQLHS